MSTDLGDANWKIRLAALDEMTTWVEGEIGNAECEVIFRFLAKKPGWNEKNFQVCSYGLKIYVIIFGVIDFFWQIGFSQSICHLLDTSRGVANLQQSLCCPHRWQPDGEIGRHQTKETCGRCSSRFCGENLAVVRTRPK
jgi:hypothetical protein